MVDNVVKRNKNTEPFDSIKIRSAVARCFTSIGHTEAEALAFGEEITNCVSNILDERVGFISVEEVQDLVEQQLMACGFFAAAKAYVLYREKHREAREANPLSGEDIERIRQNKQKYFPSETQALQFWDKYARFDAEKGRRETWDEAVQRVMRFLRGQVDKRSARLQPSEWDELAAGMLNTEAMPSMRVLQMAGPALERCNVGAYNCAFLPIDSLGSFSELLYILMQGTGVGFSVEADDVYNLPRIKRQKKGVAPSYIIPDSTEGWCNALKFGLEKWFGGEDVAFDFTRIRPQGAPLKTKGGRASGPEPLRKLLNFVRDKVLNRQGKYLTPLDAHDIACMCGDIVQVGGVRRAAEISLSDFDDSSMREAKYGAFWNIAPHRAMANNSAVYEEKPSSTRFMEEWLSLAKSGTGERGIYNREGIQKHVAKRRKKARFGVNPCGEIILRPRQFCNLSIAVARPTDTEESLTRKVRLAAILGTIQSMLTDFKFIGPDWVKNCEEERLLGVDITGQMDCPLLQPEMGWGTPSDGNCGERPSLLERLRQVAIDTNVEFAKRLGINMSLGVTCVKPSGNSSQLLDCSSGLHPRYAPYYIRRMRIGAFTPIAALLKDEGVPFHPENGQTLENASVLVFEFPVKSPEDAITRNDLDALTQLYNWRDWKKYYTEHNPSATVYVSDDEWIAVGNWVYENWDDIGGLSFLPRDGGLYSLAPYEEITREEYEKRAAALPTVDYSKLTRYESEDMTEGSKEFACVSGVCEL